MNPRNLLMLVRWSVEADKRAAAERTQRECPAVTGGGVHKKRYQTMAAALEAAETVGRKRNLRLSAYRCPECAGFHLTRQRPRNGVNGAGGTFIRAPKRK